MRRNFVEECLFVLSHPTKELALSKRFWRHHYPSPTSRSNWQDVVPTHPTELPSTHPPTHTTHSTHDPHSTPTTTNPQIETQDPVPRQSLTTPVPQAREAGNSGAREPPGPRSSRPDNPDVQRNMQETAAEPRFEQKSAQPRRGGVVCATILVQGAFDDEIDVRTGAVEEC
ncbi:hypothetical protein K505DRAFT_34601 [Melanomma pulvis-pyrius CBS 109.77]|uniref:Uncharacterized protein n=1 Tax=Melanomma pulvis-pyrius CBS 109.77 TaxID=1314802 RepID=A0A6A6XDV9_9PLEO|nr:hypothetical protein K505DRAFT_34601 [Melanomma pulvis-pyrius CBS 109.77]